MTSSEMLLCLLWAFCVGSLYDYSRPIVLKNSPESP